jgi:hypothetical protein
MVNECCVFCGQMAKEMAKQMALLRDGEGSDSTFHFLEDVVELWSV